MTDTKALVIRYGTTAAYPPVYDFVSHLLAKEVGSPSDIVILLDLHAFYSATYTQAIKDAFANSPAENLGVQKEHLFHIPSLTWQCICNTESATLPMLAFRRSAAAIVLGLLRRGTNIGPALWKVQGLRRKMIPNKGPDGRLRCICFRGFEGDTSLVNRPLKRKDPQLAWLRKNIGADAEKWVREGALVA